MDIKDKTGWPIRVGARVVWRGKANHAGIVSKVYEDKKGRGVVEFEDRSYRHRTVLATDVRVQLRR